MDMNGMPIVIRPEVYVNSLVLPVPYMMCNLNHRELAVRRPRAELTILEPVS